MGGGRWGAAGSACLCWLAVLAGLSAGLWRPTPLAGWLRLLPTVDLSRYQCTPKVQNPGYLDYELQLTTQGG